MAKPRQETGAAMRMLSELPLEQTCLGFRVTRADLARMLGCSRAYVTSLVEKGIIPVERNGRINPDTAVRALLRQQPTGGRLKYLVQIRAEIDEAHAARQAAEERASSLAEEGERLRDLLRPIVRELLEASARLDHLTEELGPLLTDDELERALDAAFERACRATDADLLAHLDDDIADMLPELLPELVEEEDSSE